MGRPIVVVQPTYNALPRLIRHMPMATSGVLTRWAYATQEGMQQRCPVRTGFLRNSITTEGAVPGSMSMQVRVGAGYAGYVEYGTRRMAARPFTRETVAITFPACIRELKQLERLL